MFNTNDGKAQEAAVRLDTVRVEALKPQSLQERKDLKAKTFYSLRPWRALRLCGLFGRRLAVSSDDASQFFAARPVGQRRCQLYAVLPPPIWMRSPMNAPNSEIMMPRTPATT